VSQVGKRNQKLNSVHQAVQFARRIPTSKGTDEHMHQVSPS